ncbi:hypothetical protein [Rubinisphaera sp.]|uniref:hypothetical protein n=1 Tax=Rubinisphaera sp. TaxID=2024857 RepID=UPI000C0CCF10|nr:hypothetical protein [Rubinisphaera sp.]MBV09702.1 hypothetical protein [Rubinisphaera sp.]HCS54123.1 hypothetical protein [Planctomycetaceae bacterium]|tara:strand:- start:1426 stop:2616 length:1191 start_codon:yes stop_codon:yes gene_type:complete
MSFPRFRPWTAAFSTALLLSVVNQADAQLFRNGLFGGNAGCNECAATQQVSFAPQQVAYAPQQTGYDPCNVCSQQQVVYRQVPVTEYRQVTQTVRKPVVETAYEDRQFTEYKTVYETKTATIPTVSYQNVTECQTVQRDMGRWVSYQQQNQKISPCAYDGSPGLFGMFNRTRQSIKNVFTPSVTTHRQYQPNIVAQQVPVTRQVAIRGEQTVSYQVARVVPETTTRQVAVRKIRWEDEQVVASLPVTSYRTVPIGTQTAYGFVPFQEGGNSSVTAQAPVPDPISVRKAEAPTPAVKKTAEKDNKFEPEPAKKDNSGTFSPFGSGMNESKERNHVQPASYQEVVQTNHSPASPAKPTVPSMIRSNGWRARTTLSENSSLSSGSSTDGPALQVVKATN